MILIGENLNVISQTLGPALRDRNAGPIEEMAKQETAAGVDLIAALDRQVVKYGACGDTLQTLDTDILDHECLRL